MTDLPDSVDYATDELIGKTIRQYVFPLRCMSLVLTTTAGNLLRARYSQLPIACARLSTTTGSVWYHFLSQLMKLTRRCQIMLLDQGKLVEFDKPAVLLSNPQSSFYNLCKAAGKQEFATLQMLAGL